MVFKTLIILLLSTTLAVAGAKTIGSKKDYTRQQKIQNGTIVEKKYTTCRLKKILQSRSGDQACVYEGGNKTFELMFDNNCPKQFKCCLLYTSPSPRDED